MTITIIKELLQPTERGKILCLNMLHAELHGYFSNTDHVDLLENLAILLLEALPQRSDIRDYATKLGTNLNLAQSTEDKNRELLNINNQYPEDFCGAIIRCIGDIIFTDPEKKFLLKRKQVASCNKDFVSCIKSSTVINYMIDDSKLADSGFLIKPVMPLDFSKIDATQRNKFIKNIKKILSDKEQRKKYLLSEAKFWNPLIPYIWLTDSKEIQKIKEETEIGEYANAVRDKLGLVHIGCDELIVEFRIPFSYIKNHELLAQPTIFEGIEHSRFKAFVDGDPDGSCGRTVDLKSLLGFKSKMDSLDGLPEFVASVEQLPNFDDWEFEVIGFTNTHPENVIPNDKTGRSLADAHFVSALTTKYC